MAQHNQCLQPYFLKAGYIYISYNQRNSKKISPTHSNVNRENREILMFEEKDQLTLQYAVVNYT